MSGSKFQTLQMHKPIPDSLKAPTSDSDSPTLFVLLNKIYSTILNSIYCSIYFTDQLQSALHVTQLTCNFLFVPELIFHIHVC